MPLALFVGGPFHGQMKHVLHYSAQTVSGDGTGGAYEPFTMWSKRGDQMILRCMVDADLAPYRAERLKHTIDAMMRNVPCSEPYTEATGEVA